MSRLERQTYSREGKFVLLYQKKKKVTNQDVGHFSIYIICRIYWVYIMCSRFPSDY